MVGSHLGFPPVVVVQCWLRLQASGGWADLSGRGWSSAENSAGLSTRAPLRNLSCGSFFLKHGGWLQETQAEAARRLMPLSQNPRHHFCHTQGQGPRSVQIQGEENWALPVDVSCSVQMGSIFFDEPSCIRRAFSREIRRNKYERQERHCDLVEGV